MIPQDPYILLSYINTKLRDEYDSPEALCEDLELDAAELAARMAAIGRSYDPAANQFRADS